MANPYNPQNPANPNYFGGRNEYLKLIKEKIEGSISYKRSSGILVYGYRGIGKTSMLYKIAAEAEKVGKNIIVYRRLGSTTTDKDLYRLISEEVIEAVRKNSAIKSIIESVKDNVSRVHTPLLDLDIKTEIEKSSYYLWQKVRDGIAGMDFIMIEIDDADYLSSEALGELKSIVEAQSKTPLLLVVSGGESFEEKLDKDYSPIARIFSGASFNLGSFTLSEIREVLQEPVKGTDTNWSEEAINKVNDLSNGYPYLVQCIAAASYIENGVITKERVEERLKVALEIGKPWLNNEIKTASDSDISSFFRIAKLNKQDFTSAELLNEGISAVYVGRLVRLKVIKKISRGRYKLIKAPIIAYYHMLVRGIEA
ncbi:MAG: ATP-binding protein [Candidatus Marsarchaeota archaeon]|nr:ATP-binding protein [Candidatus Marsarchaeota archaeon]